MAIIGIEEKRNIMSDDCDPEDAGLQSYLGERDDDGRPDGEGVGVFTQTYTEYHGMWSSGRPAGAGRFTFLCGRHLALEVERPSAPDFIRLQSRLAPGYIWPQENRQGRREIHIGGLTYNCSATHDGCVRLEADAGAAREQSTPQCIVAEIVIGGRCCGRGRRHSR